VVAALVHAASAASVGLVLGLLLLDDVDDLVGHAEVLDLRCVSEGARAGQVCTDCAAADVDLGQAHELVTVGAGLDDFAQGEVHPGVAVDEQAVERLAALELDKHGVAGRGREQTKRKLQGSEEDGGGGIGVGTHHGESVGKSGIRG
jgi:hypothetical protein